MQRGITTSSSAAIRLGGALLLLAAATGFRLYGSLQEPFWLDEAYSAYAAGKGFDFLWHVVPSYETHPPFYYSLLRVWTLIFGDSLAAYRSLGFVTGLATLPLIALAARDVARGCGLDPDRIGWGTVAFAALSIALVAMTREVRPYPVMILVYTATMWALARIGIAAERGRGIAVRPYLAYLAGLALMLWLHNLGVLYAAALGTALAILVLRPGLSRRDWAWLIGGHVLVALVWLPALLILADQAPTWISATWLRFSWAAVPVRLGVLYAARGAVAGTALVVLAMLAAWRLVDSVPRRRMAAALFALALMPVVASIAISALVAPVFILRTMTPVAVPAMLLLAIGMLGWTTGWRRGLGLAAGLVVLVHMAAADIHEREQAGGPEDWYGVADFLAQRWRPGDVVLAYPNESALPLDFALRDRGLSIPVRPIPTPVPSIGVGGWYPTGSRGVVSLPRPRLRAIAQEPAVQAAPTIWLLRSGARTYDRGNMFLQELGRGRRPVGHFYHYPIDLIGLAPVPVSARRAAPAGAAAAH